MKTSLDRRHEFKYRSVFDYHELYKHFLKKEILSITHAEKLICLAALNYAPLIARNSNDARGTVESEENLALQHTAAAWEELVPNLPRKAYVLLEELNFRRSTLKVIELQTTDSGDTDKLLLELQDGHRIETCIMRYLRNPFKGMTPEASAAAAAAAIPLGERATVCVSSQVGCRMNCTFCATGTLGLSANLTSGEILEQIIVANHMEKIHRQDNGTYEKIPDGKYVRNIVYMGMGEPLDNYDEVVRSIRMLTNTRMLGFTSSKVTLSTVGAEPDRIRRLIKDAPKISLALSLHAPTQELREAIVPTAKSSTIEDLLSACFAFVNNQRALSKTSAKRQSLCVEYCLLQDVNDLPQVAHDLGQLFASHTEYVMVNLIPYNPTDVGCNYKPPSFERVQSFADVLRQYGVRVFFRTEKGASIAGACGQLAASKRGSKNRRLQEGKSTDIEDDLTQQQIPIGLNGLSKNRNSNSKMLTPSQPDPSQVDPSQQNLVQKDGQLTFAKGQPTTIMKQQLPSSSALTEFPVTAGPGDLTSVSPTPCVDLSKVNIGESDQSTTTTNSGLGCSSFASKSRHAIRTEGEMISSSLYTRRLYRWTSHGAKSVESPIDIAHCRLRADLMSFAADAKTFLKKRFPSAGERDIRAKITWYGSLVLAIAMYGALTFYGGGGTNSTQQRKRRRERGLGTPILAKMNL